jgi:hypothetical protein
MKKKTKPPTTFTVGTDWIGDEIPEGWEELKKKPPKNLKKDDLGKW